MNINLGVVDISSDEDDENRWRGQSVAWFSDMFEEREKLDDVVVIGDYSPAVKDRCSDAIPRQLDSGDISDDDCVVLDGDPDGPVCVTGDDKVPADGSDDVVVVAEKGQSACRDYPHPRHLCANFPFSSTPHVNYCGMCHCYVCDSPAPCNFWGNGYAFTDHCHSTDKEARWKMLRASRQQSIPSSDIRKPTNASQFMTIPLLNPPVTRVPIMIPTPPCNEQRLQGCTTTYVPRPAIINQRRPFHSLNSRLAQRQHLVRTQSFPRTDHTQRHRSGGGELPPQTMHNHSRFKRVGFSRSLSANSHPIYPCSAATNCGQTYEISSAEVSQITSADDGSDTINYWRKVLAGLAKDLGVEENPNGSQLVSDFSESSDSRQSHSQVSKPQDEFIPTSGHDSDCLNFATSQKNIICQQEVGISNAPASKENIATEEINLENCPSPNLESCLSPMEGKDIPGFGDLETASLLYDLDMSWSPL